MEVLILQARTLGPGEISQVRGALLPLLQSLRQNPPAWAQQASASPLLLGGSGLGHTPDLARSQERKKMAPS